MYIYILLEVSLENFDGLMVTFEKQKFKKKYLANFYGWFSRFYGK